MFNNLSLSSFKYSNLQRNNLPILTPNKSFVESKHSSINYFPDNFERGLTEKKNQMDLIFNENRISY